MMETMGASWLPNEHISQQVLGSIYGTSTSSEWMPEEVSAGDSSQHQDISPGMPYGWIPERQTSVDEALFLSGNPELNNLDLLHSHGYPSPSDWTPFVNQSNHLGQFSALAYHNHSEVHATIPPQFVTESIVPLPPPNLELYSRIILDEGRSPGVLRDGSPQDTGTIDPPNLPSVSPNLKRKTPPTEIKRDSQSGKTKGNLVPDAQGNLRGLVALSVASRKRRKTATEEEKASTAETKKHGACKRCKQLKQKCDHSLGPFHPCKGCFTAKPIALTFACTLRNKLLDVKLFRLGPLDDKNHPLRFKRDVLVTGTTTLDIKPEVLIAQGIEKLFRIKITPYEKQTGDKVDYEWFENGKKRVIEMPHYYIQDVASTEDYMRSYVKECSNAYLNKFVDWHNPIISRVFEKARELRSESKLVDLALDLWVASRFIERSWNIRGRLPHGFREDMAFGSPWTGTIPVTPIIDQQLDQIVIKRVLIPLRDEFLNMLQKDVYDEAKAKKESFEIFHACFIALNSFEKNLEHGRRFAKRYGHQGRYGPRGRYIPQEGYFHAAKTILAHWHHVLCRGMNPLSVDNEIKLKYWEDESSEQIRRSYVTLLKKDIRDNRRYFTGLSNANKYESPLYWCHQLFDSNWTAGPVHIEEINDDNE